MINEALLEIREMCLKHGYDMVRDGHLPEPKAEAPVFKEISREIQEELNYFHDDLAQAAEENIAKFNQEQASVFNVIKKSVDNKEGAMIALDVFDHSCR